MTTEGLTRTTRRAAANSRAIVDAAEELILEVGSDALTLDAVSARADVAVQTIYNRVGGRSALLIAVAERAFEENRQYMDAAYAAPGTPIERVLRAAEAYTRFAVERPHQFRLLADPPNEPNALARVADLIEEQNTKLATAISDGIADETIPAHIDPTMTATVLWAAWNGILALRWRADRLRADDTQIQGLVATMAQIVINGLTKD
ncbi:MULTISPECIES: TetR/AcrR family transcriptional regulator [unclassified Rhodococcus (in: high G+C Gram-positive bacteria)]|uniref:TetR/AcrR family transcriptional regulator n=1 Tax=unclassified Rhodococcus (in: high G+C Gram-positive bacteria) TaxID=192944 RepID=UPI00163AF3A0|nr:MULTISPECIES: TetR/AcrR family transcriptional regulator [unclassified Rhodococcus (in: high G+C Gram-positive bacteria)]MBC2641926.1 TetR/AcrR family transcriptional regulator [Rhodococcus sp. 3A]MBC2893333.1 TetR/AcrR family transcriptional regulator [Rhodococcus sp. 4CII]